MPPKKKPSFSKPGKKQSTVPIADHVKSVLVSLQDLSNTKTLDEMGSRYGIHTKKAFGVPMAKMLKLSKELGRSHELALALWKTGWYEARMVACMVDEPERVTSSQMDDWCRDFDNWGICDTVCFKLFDQVPHAYGKVKQWVKAEEEFIKRGGFALLACLALHDKKADDEVFYPYLPLIEKAASDDRNFVKKGVLWALRGIGTRSAEMKAEAIILAEHLADSSEPSARWIGKTALREMTRRK